MPNDQDFASPAREKVFTLLSKLGLSCTTINHPPVHTVEEALPYWAQLDGVHTKNLFLKDAKGVLWLIAAPTDRTIDLKLLPRQIGAKRLSFANGDLLFEVLGVRQGAVSPLAVINDMAGRVRVVLDEEMMRAPRVNFHPLVNTSSTLLRSEDLSAFLRACDHEPLVVDLRAVPAEAPAG